MSKRDGRRNKPAEVVFYSYPKLIFVWPVIVMGLLLYLLPAGWLNAQDIVVTPKEGDAVQGRLVAETFSPERSITVETQDDRKVTFARSDIKMLRSSTVGEFFGWFYLITVILVTLTIGVDVERNYAIFWLVTFGMIYFLGLWLANFDFFTLFGDLYRWLANLDVRYNQGYGLAFSLLLSIPYAVMFLWTRLQHRWRITHNEFENYSFGRADDSLARGAKRVRSTYPDVFELLLCGAGTLIVYSATGRQELRRIRNVPMLPWKRKRINQILETTAVTTTDAIFEEEFDAEQEESDGLDAGDQGEAPEGEEIGDENL